VTVAKFPRRFRNLPLADVASRRVPVAVNLPSRLLGLALLRPERAGEGLLIPRCRSVHTFGMRFPVHVVFCDRDLRPISVRGSVAPRRLVREPRAAAVVELPVASLGE
jgi:uncharacterized protein